MLKVIQLLLRLLLLVLVLLQRLSRPLVLISLTGFVSRVCVVRLRNSFFTDSGFDLIKEHQHIIWLSVWH